MPHTHVVAVWTVWGATEGLSSITETAHTNLRTGEDGGKENRRRVRTNLKLKDMNTDCLANDDREIEVVVPSLCWRHIRVTQPLVVQHAPMLRTQIWPICLNLNLEGWLRSGSIVLSGSIVPWVHCSVNNQTMWQWHKWLFVSRQVVLDFPELLKYERRQMIIGTWMEIFVRNFG